MSRPLLALALFAACGSAATTSGGYQPPLTSASTSRSPTTTPRWTRCPVSGGELRLVAPRRDARRQPARGRDRVSAPPHRRPRARRRHDGDVHGRRRRSRTRTTSRSRRSTCSRSATRPRSRILDHDRRAHDHRRDREAEQARKIYEEAKAKGHTAALLEQDKRNIFKQQHREHRAARADRGAAEYTELLDYADGQYEMAVPLVVGPRYLPAERRPHPVGAQRAGTPAAPA